MKTLAIRLDDDVAQFLAVVAQLEGTSVIDQIRKAIMNHLTRTMADGELTEKAQAALDEIDREASVRKQAISTLLGPGRSDDGGSPKNGARRRTSTKSEEERVNPIGFAPPLREMGQPHLG